MVNTFRMLSILTCIALIAADPATQPASQPAEEKPDETKPAPVAVGEMWIGISDNEHRAKNNEARLRIEKVQGREFWAVYTLEVTNRDQRRLLLHGQFHKEGNGFAARPEKILGGDWQSEVLKEKWSGVVKNDQMLLIRVLSNGSRATHEMTRRQRDRK